jgi:hypothetical protein
MEDNFECPLCYSKSNCRKNLDGTNGYQLFHCEFYNSEFNISDDICEMPNSEKNKILDLILEYILKRKYLKKNDYKNKLFFYISESDTKHEETETSEKVNFYNDISKYPNNASDLSNRILMNLSYRYPKYGDNFMLLPQMSRLFFEHESNYIRITGIMNLLLDFGYVKHSNPINHYFITADGWKKIDSTRQLENDIHQGFIAMEFGDRTQNIREALRTAIEKSRYYVIFIDEKEHNHQIVPEIFYEIKRSKFMVVDITYPNYGAYYEAGYGQALGKEVIVCCRKKEFDDKETRPHFDIAQKSMIIWTDEEDLIQRLQRRIEATVN